jgi:pimeloyl-ACP methyl ester carboxylesterase
LDNLTIIGHGLGGTTAVMAASKDKRVRRVITFDPWLTPLKEEI